MSTGNEYEFVNTGSLTENTAIQLINQDFGITEFTFGPAENCGMPLAQINALIFYGPPALNPNPNKMQPLPLLPDLGVVQSGNLLCWSLPLNSGDTYSWTVTTDTNLGSSFSIFVQGATSLLNGPPPNWEITNPLNAFTNFFLPAEAILLPEAPPGMPPPIACGEGGIHLAFVVDHQDREHRRTELYFKKITRLDRKTLRPGMIEYLERHFPLADGDVAMTYGVERVVPAPEGVRSTRPLAIERTGFISAKTYDQLREREEVGDGVPLEREIRAGELHQGLVRINVKPGHSTIVSIRHVVARGASHEKSGVAERLLGELTLVVCGTKRG
jgi:hypothetical protein